MNQAVLYIIDPLSSLNPKKDTSLLMMAAAREAGLSTWVATMPDLVLDASQQNAESPLLIKATEVHIKLDKDNWLQTGQTELKRSNFFQTIWIRKDPPFDSEYLYLTQKLSIAEQYGTTVWNRPSAIRDFNEKLAIFQFSKFIAPSYVGQNLDELQLFIDKEQDIIAKPLDGMGGRGILRVQADDKNRHSMLELLTDGGKHSIMLQKYLPEISEGDKRIIVIDGIPHDHVLHRMPSNDDLRGNLAAGGKAIVKPLSTSNRILAEAVGKKLVQEGVRLAGLDVIGNSLTEVNVTSPTCLQEIYRDTGVNLAAKLC